MDDKRLKRILANRQSAARSRERKSRYEKELAMKVERLRIIEANVTAKLAEAERRTAYMVARNKVLRMVLEAKSQQLQLTTELNQAMKEEIKRLMVKNILMAADSGNYVLLAEELLPNFMDFCQKN